MGRCRLRLFGHDFTKYLACGGKVKIVAVIANPRLAMRILESMEIAAACPHCGGLSMEIWGGSNRYPHCDRSSRIFQMPEEGHAAFRAASCPFTP